MKKGNKRKKSPSKTLKVFINGKMVEGKRATDIFINTIITIGPEKIAESNKYTVDGLPLVVFEEDNRKQMKSLGEQGYICTHSSTIAKKKLIEKIARSLGINIIVKVEERF